MKGDIKTTRIRRKSARWEATWEICPGCWCVAYGWTRRSALRRLRRERGL